MYLEHISVVHSVRGDISRTAAPRKSLGARAPGVLSLETGRARQVATSEISSHSSRLGAHSALSTAKASPDRCCSQSVLFCPPHAVLGAGRDEEASLTASNRLFCEMCWDWCNNKSTSQWQTIDITSVTWVENTVLGFYLAPLGDVQSPGKGQGDKMSGSEGALQCTDNRRPYMLWAVLTDCRAEGSRSSLTRNDNRRTRLSLLWITFDSGFRECSVYWIGDRHIYKQYLYFKNPAGLNHRNQHLPLIISKVTISIDKFHQLFQTRSRKSCVKTYTGCVRSVRPLSCQWNSSHRFQTFMLTCWILIQHVKNTWLLQVFSFGTILSIERTAVCCSVDNED